MTDHPMLFSGPMVRALIEGRKTQTRRVLEPQPDFRGGAGYRHDAEEWGWEDEDGCHISVLDIAPNGYRVGDRVWVKEAWRIGAWDWNNAQVALDYCDGPRKEWLPVDDTGMLHRLIDQSRDDAKSQNRLLRHSYYEYSWSPGDSPCRWRPSIHMPRWASRLTLIVTDVRVQRLQEITPADAIAEGCTTYANSATIDCDTPNPRDDFRDLWDSLNAKRAPWSSNPWVCALSFDVHRRNIDQMEGEA